MNLLNDLADIIKSEFAEQGIRSPEGADIRTLTSRWLEMRIRRIEPVPRAVYLSDEIHHSLGRLASSRDAKKLEAWGTVFYLRHAFQQGCSVISFLTNRVDDTEKTDGLLWDYGIHHLHLGRKTVKDGFVERTDQLLFAIVSDEAAYFVDVRPHRDQGFEWVRQDLLVIVHRNWPALIEDRVLHGVSGNTITDVEKKELRRKHANVIHEVGGKYIAPLGWGMNADGHSTRCWFLAAKLIHEVTWCQDNADLARSEVRAVLSNRGIRPDHQIDLQLVRVSDCDMTYEVASKVTASKSPGASVFQAGFAIVASWGTMNCRCHSIVSM